MATNGNSYHNKIEKLLKPHKTIRDVLHGDIMVTKLEVAVMDTEEFQRLREIKQLGPTYLVYPCAMHSRFEHSLGTLYMAQYLLDCLQRNPYPDPEFEFTNYYTLLTRICALLHDLAHIPFGHTLEDEGFLLNSQWDDEERREYFLADNSTIGNRIITILNENGQDGREFLQETRNILFAKTEEDIEKLKYPFISDMINNAVCADLLDYLARDLYFCGLRENYDERFLSYFYVTSYNGQWRFVLRLIKPRTGRVRRDVLYEVLHMLRLRYSLAEKVYYHHTKVDSSAMIISAVYSALKNKIISKQDIFKMGDNELLTLVGKDDIGGYILNKMKRRELYKPVYKLSYTEERLVSQTQRRKEVIKRFNDPRFRYEAERTLEDMNFLKRGQVIVYCPGPEMGQKAAEILVDLGTKIGPLDKIADENVKTEIRSSIVDKHLYLWNMFVFVDPELSQEQRINVVSDCITKIVGETNEIEEYREIQEGYLERFRERAENEFGYSISAKQMAEVKSTTKKHSEGKEFFDSIISYENFLREIKRRL